MKKTKKEIKKAGLQLSRLTTRPGIHRVRWIAKQLRLEGRIGTASSLADQWECSHKTIARDIDLLRTMFDFPIVYDQSRYLYKLEGVIPEAVL